MKTYLNPNQTVISFDLEPIEYNEPLEFVIESSNSPKTSLIKDWLKRSEKLKNIGANLQLKANEINTEVSGNWTHRRQGFADAAKKKQERLLKISKIAFALSDNFKKSIDVRLSKISSATDIEFILDGRKYYPESFTEERIKKEHISDHVVQHTNERISKLKKLGLDSLEDLEFVYDYLNDIGIVKVDEDKMQLDKLLVEARASKFPGFFPTPNDVIDLMIDSAKIRDSDSILEPSAGIGSIQDRLREEGYNNEITNIETNFNLAEIIKLKGYDVIHTDILGYREEKKYDRILMNPPFEGTYPISHITHCYSLLSETGILVSVIPKGILNKSTGPFKAFRKFVEENNGYLVEIEGNPFKGSFKNTNVQVNLLVISK